MKRNNFLSRFIVVTLTAALLLVSGSRAYRVSALADPVQSVAPVFDTQIYQLQDYIDHGGLGEPQLDIFYIMAGLYAVGQMGAEDYKLSNPYANQDGVLAWLKDVGIETYNTLIGLAPDTIRMADGTLISTDAYKRVLSAYVGDLFGCAVKASQYNSVSDFTDDVANSEHYFIPWNSQIQYGLNTMYQLYGGFYEWQFSDAGPFTSNFTWNRYSLSGTALAHYNELVSDLSGHHVQTNQAAASARNILTAFPSTYNLFINTTSNTVYLCDNNGSTIAQILRPFCVFTDSAGDSYTVNFHIDSINFPSRSVSLFNHDTYVDVVRDVYNSFSDTSKAVCFGDGSWTSYYFNPENIISHCYVGASWANRHEIFNISNLNLDDSDQPYYVSVPEDDNYLLDVKGILLDILNNTDLMDVFINNIYTPDGVLVHDTDLIRVTLRLLQDYELANPPLPVNLNDISELTENTYLDMVKERATNAGSTLANLVAFWHNCDFELVYVLFGAGITVLIGAFIGKWGHS